MLVDLHGLANIEAEEAYYTSDPELMKVAEIFSARARDKALRHNGDVVLHDIGKANLELTPVLDLLGACMGCGLKSMTYGTLPEEVNAQLAEDNIPYTIKNIEFKPRSKQGVLYLR